MNTTDVFTKNLIAYNEGYRIIANKGGTRSSKTFSILQLIRLIMEMSKKHLTITTVSHSFPHLFGGAIRDFDNILIEDNFNLDIVRTKNPHIYKINKSLHEFVGFDKPGKAIGAARDILFVNEANKIPHSICHHLIQRTTKCVFLDWNPSEDFWFYQQGYADRQDCKIINSTFYDNIQNLTKGQLDELRIARDKAQDEEKRGVFGYWWNWWQVYGLGKQGQLEGVIFHNCSEYSELPDVEMYKMFVVDWGGNDPTTLTELNIDGKNLRLYVKEHIYQPQILNSKLIEYIHQVNENNRIVICDSARKDKIFEFQMAGINAIGATKGEGSVIDGIERLQEFTIFVHKDSSNAIREFSSYKWIKDELTGKVLNEPEDNNNHCFTANTKIITLKGIKNIRDIDESDFVLTSNGYKKVLKRFHNGLKLTKEYTIQFDTFSLSLKCTSEHLIKTNQGWIQISQLKSGMIVYLFKNLMEKFINFGLKNDIFQEVQNVCIQKFGNFIINLLKKVFIFIIKILIHGIIGLKILNLLKVQNIKANMEKIEQKTILNGLKNFIMQVLQKPQNGIDQMKVSNGIKNKVQKHGLIENIKHLFVNNVGKNTKQDIQEYQNIVAITVKHVHLGKEERKFVYDLMIDEQHEYFANGLLVHNCIDPIRYGIRFYRRAVKPL